MKMNLFLIFSILVLRQVAFAQASRDQELLQGLWTQDCANRNDRSEEFVASTVTLKESFYADDSCQQPLLAFVNEGTFILPASEQMDFSFTSVRVQLGDERFVQDFNRRAVCGFQDWKIDEEKEISGRPCEIFTKGSPQKIPTVGDKRYGIYHLEDDRLLFGKLTQDENAMTPEKRPTKLDPRAYSRNYQR